MPAMVAARPATALLELPAAAPFVQICCKGPDRAGAGEKKRWYSAISFAADPGPGRLCNRFGHAPAPERPRSPTRTASVPPPAFRAIMPLRAPDPAVGRARPSTCTEPGDCVPGPVVSRRASFYTPLPGADYSARRRIHGL